jgi:hypothetical protein
LKNILEGKSYILRKTSWYSKNAYSDENLAKNPMGEIHSENHEILELQKPEDMGLSDPLDA